MSARLPLLLAVLALGGCARSEPPGDAEAPPTELVRRITYACGDGRTLEALYPERDTAQLKLAGNDYLLKIAISGSGARYVGDGLQWWTKGREGTLAALKAGERIAEDPGVTCVEAGHGPPTPGTPGGLPDDRTPLSERPAAAGGAQAAATVVETYYALVESGRSSQAAALRSDGQVMDVRAYDTLHAEVGAPGRVEGAAGSLYVDVPVVLYGRYAAGGPVRLSGKVTLRRANNIPGATADELRWRIAKIAVE